MLVSFQHFARTLAIEFDLPLEVVKHGAAFVHDLEFDDFQFFRLALLMESLVTDFEFASDHPIDELTVGALYRRYAVEAAMR